MPEAKNIDTKNDEEKTIAPVEELSETGTIEKQPDTKSHFRATFRCDKDEEIEIKTRAADAGMSINEYLLKCATIPSKVIEHPVSVAPPIAVTTDVPGAPIQGVPTQIEYQIPLSPQEAFMNEFFVHYKFNPNFKSVVLRDVKKTGVLLKPLDFSLEMSKGSSGIADAWLISKIVQQYADDYEKFQLSQQVMNRALQPRNSGYQQNPGDYTTNPYSQNPYQSQGYVPQSFQDMRLHDENAQLKAKIELLMETKRQSEILQLRELIPNAEEIKNMITQSLVSRSQNVTAEDVKKIIREDTGRPVEGMATTGVDGKSVVELQRAKYEYQIKEKEMEAESKKYDSMGKFVKDLGEDVILPAAEAFGRGVASQPVMPLPDAQQALEQPVSQKKDVMRQIVCPTCRTMLELPPHLKNAECPECKTNFHIDESGIITVVKSPEEPEENIKPDTTPPTEEKTEEKSLGNCTKCGHAVTDETGGPHQIGRTLKGAVTCIACLKLEEKEKLAKEQPNADTGREHQIPGQIGICETCGAGIVDESTLGRRGPDGKIFCKNCMKTKEELKNE